MRLKKYINIAALSIVGVATLSSCSDWLDVTPNDKTTADQQFSTRAGFYAAVNGTYNQLASTSLYGKNLSWGAVDLHAKRYQVTSSSPSNYYWANWTYISPAVSPFVDETYVKPTLNNIWTTAYNTILNANVILQNLETKGDVLGNTEQGKKDKALIKGDMLALRAMMHLDLLRIFGPIPTTAEAGTLKIMPYNTSAEAKVNDMLTTKEVAAKVLEDLIVADSLLAIDPVLTDGPLSDVDNNAADNYMRYRQLRVNSYAIAILKARAYMWLGDTDNALVEAQKITDDPKVDTLFPWVNSATLLGNTRNPDRVFSTEVFFGVYNKDRANIYDYNFNTVGLNYGSSLLRPRSGYIKNTVFPADKQSDYRFLSQWHSDGEYDEFTKFKGIEYSQSNPPLFAFLMPLIRKSEAYYIAAECLRTTDTPKALDYINKVKTNRGTPVMDGTSTAASIMKELVYEYMREFWGEGQIFYFFKRVVNKNWTYIDTYMNGYANSMEYCRNSEMMPGTPTSEVESR